MRRIHQQVLRLHVPVDDAFLVRHLERAADLLVIGDRLELRADGFTGQALAGLGGGGVGQSMVRDGVPVGTEGGWAQVNLRPSERWEIGRGAGIDDPDDEDLGPGARLRNVAVEGHVTWRRLPAVVGLVEGHITWRRLPAVVGLEVRSLRTRYAAPAGSLSATHVNLGMGFEF